MSDTTNISEANGAGIITGPSTLESRADEAFGALESADAADSPQPPAADAAAPADSNASEDPLAKARAERKAEWKAKFEELNARQRAIVDASHARRENEHLRVRLAEAEARTKAYESYVDPTKLTKEQFFQLAHQNPELSPKELGEWIREQTADPIQAATRAARTAVDPVVAKLQADLAAANAKIDNFMQQQKSASEQAQERAAVQEFASFTTQNAATSPLAARFLESQGVDQFEKLVMGAAQALPQNAGPQALLDEIEDRLSELGKLYAASTAPQRPQANPPRPNPAAAQAPTHVTNTLAQQRSGVVNEDAHWARMSLGERAAALFDD